MTLELKYLLYVTVLTALLWVPYILNRIAVRGVADTVGYPENPKPVAKWASRLQAAHANAVENLVVFATLVLIAHVTGVSNEATVLASCVYFWARLAHAVVYALGMPWLRTLTFTAAFLCQAALAWQLLA
ncbi:MAG: MAPEG family protein [Steroidobacteraceae bacterium]